jgi:4a-hydroxytetrahydrobiopterin dehydratase
MNWAGFSATCLAIHGLCPDTYLKVWLKIPLIVFAARNAGRQGAPPMAPLNPQEIRERQAALPDWQIEGGELVKTFAFKDFRAALAFVNRVGEAAETAGHHPDIDIRYNRVRLALVTHDAGGLTEKDFSLATQANQIG